MNAVQEKELSVLKAVIDVLNKHNLSYFAIGGTCLGAVRHQGFIPWDDDIDIAMPRTDFELFRTEFYKELPEKYKLLDGKNCRSHAFLFIKIHDSSTTLVKDYSLNSPERYTGVDIDIMPIDGLPDNKALTKTYLKKIRFYGRLNRANRPYTIPASNVKEVAMELMKRAFRKVHRYDYYYDKIQKIVGDYSFEKSNKVFFTWRWGLKKSSTYKNVFEKRIFEGVDYLQFETIQIAVPILYKEYLSLDFGDYMQLPPVEKRVSDHNIAICDMDTPCEYYAEIKRKEQTK